MVLTPLFSLKQDETFVIVILKIPFLKPSTLDFVLEAREFKFCAHPYFLRLTFPHEIVENGQQKSQYDLEKGELTVYLPKAVPGQDFENLDMITTLMAPRSARPLIQEIPAAAQPPNVDQEMQQAPPVEESLEKMYEKEEHLLDRLISGENVPLSEINGPRAATSANNLLPLYPYGFNNNYSNYFVAKVEHLAELIEASDPDHMPPEQRRQARLAQEEIKFNPEHYMGDFAMDEEIQELIQFVPRWCAEEAARAQGTSVVEFTQDEVATLAALPNKNYLLDNELQTFLGLVDILFAYAYDARTTMGEHTVESSWTISRLSATLSWFDHTFDNAAQVFLSGIRRSLCYPLYRNWELATLVVADTKRILANGRKSVVQSLLSVKQLFDKSDVRRHLSVLYINDYLVWIQHLSEGDYARLCSPVFGVSIDQKAVGWPLEQLETEALARAEPIDEN